jgi:hypothetical protein
VSTRLPHRSRRGVLAALLLALTLLFFITQSITAVQASHQPGATGHTYVVNTTADTVDADAGLNIFLPFIRK